MTQGIPFKAEKEKIIHSMIKYGAKFALVAMDFKVTRRTIERYVEQNPDVKALVEEVRLGAEDDDLDLALYTLQYLQQRAKSYPAQAFNAAKLVLENKGESVGYGRSKVLDRQLGNQFDGWDDRSAVEYQEKVVKVDEEQSQ